MTTATSNAAPNHAPGASTTHTTGSLGAAVGATLVGPADLPITNLEAMERAGPGSLTFIRSGKFANRWGASKAGAAVVTRSIQVPDHDPSKRALLLVDDADLAMAKLLEMFQRPPYRPDPGIHPTAVIDPSARVGAGVAIGPHCFVGPRSVIGDGCAFHAGVYIGADVKIGPQTVLHSGVRILDRCSVGAQCLFWPGAVIGADGFGFRPAPDGKGLVKIPHIGHVEIGHQVEIGANSCVDRGKFGATILGDGCKLDNFVQIGHNCILGRAVVICGHSGTSGSVTIGDGAILAGGVGVADNLTIGARATVAARSSVMEDVPAGDTWMGYPATRYMDAMRSFSVIRELPELAKAVRQLKKQMEARK